jgi:SAM-dependent methyltransferase
MSWYTEFFASGDYARVYEGLEEDAAKQAACVVRELALKPGERLLDLCCGTGRHARELQARGVRLAGLDLDLASLQRAGVPCARADMRSLPLRSASLDAAANLFSSFGYLESDAEDERVLAELSRVLRPGGRLFLDLLNREHALSGFVDTQQRVAGDGTLVVERRSWDALASRLTVSFLLVPTEGAQRESVGHSLRLYTLTEIARMLARRQLAVERVLGGFGGEPYGLETPRMILIARRE